jgi:hypothetical protein
MHIQTIKRIKEHLDRCDDALNNCGADGLNQLQMHLRMACEWAINLELSVQRDASLSDEMRSILQFAAKEVIRLDNVQVINMLRAIADVQQTINKLINLE